MKKYKKVYIEITNICNLSCAFCPKTKRAPKMMTVEEFCHVVKRVKPYTGHVYLHIMGEPLLHPELGTFLDMAHELGLRVNITTNGTQFKEVSPVLLSSPALRKVGISLHCIDGNDKVFDEVQYIENIADFVNDASRAGIICELRFWNLGGDSTKEHDKQNQDRRNLKLLKLLSDRLEIDDKIAEEALKKRKMKLRENIYIEAAEQFEWPDISLGKCVESVFCHGLRDHFGILSDGTVVPCCLDHDGDIPLGNIFEKSLEDILNSDRARSIYDGFSARNAAEELCKRCGYARRF